jgi:hypothetical protein
MMAGSASLELARTRFGSMFGCCLLGATVGAFILSGPPRACAVVVVDDFSDGTDGSAGTPTNPTDSPPNVSGPVWSRYDAEVFSFGQGWDASTGQYRLTAPCNGAFASAGGQYGFAGSFVNQNFNDFSMSVDIVKPTGNPTYVPTGYLFGILAHTNGNNLNAFDISGGLTGYLFGYNQSGTTGTPRIEITKLKSGASTGVVASTEIALDLLNKNYMLKLTGVGNVFTGQVFEVGSTTPLATASGPDNNVKGVPAFLSGYPGVFGLSVTATNDVDVTFDNFKSEDLVAGIPGDYNNNGAVDAADYVLWRKGGPLQNEVDAPGTVNAADYTEWRARFGNPPGSGAGLESGGSVPEPSSVVLAVTGIAGSCFARRRRDCLVRHQHREERAA